MTAEQRVETILASIREAIDDDAAQPVTTTHKEQGTLMRGAMREMRVSFDPAATLKSNDLQIEELRQRVARNVEAALMVAPPVVEPTITKSSPRSDVFTGVLSGTATVREESARAPRTIPRAPRYAQPQPAPDYREEPRRAPQSDYAEERRYAAPRERYAEPQRNWDEPEPYEAQSYEEPYYEQPAYEAPPQRQRPRALMSPANTQNARGSFEDLTEAIMSRSGGERGIEDMTREMLRTYLRNWLDDNLPELVERLVREEIERVARGR